MSSAGAAYLSRTWDRDKVMALVQFIPMTLNGPLQALGSKGLQQSLDKLGGMADGYRAITRLSLLLNNLSPETLASIKQIRDPVLKSMTIVEHIFSTLFCPFEHLAVLQGHGVISANSRFGGMAVYCWFWSLLVGTFRQIYQMMLAYPYLSPKATDTASVKRQAEWRRMIIGLVKTLSFLVFSLTCFPAKGKPQLLGSAGLLAPLHKLVELTAPKALHLPTTVRGALGLTATICDFL